MSLPSILVLIGSLLTAIGGVLTSTREARERGNFEAELRKRADEQRDKSEQIAALIAEQLELQQQVVQGVNTLLAEGKITKEDARRVFSRVFSETLGFQENLQPKFIPGGKQKP